MTTRPAALRGSIEGSRDLSLRRHEIIVADAGFGSVENLEHLQVDEQRALIPDRRRKLVARGKSSKGEYDRSSATRRTATATSVRRGEAAEVHPGDGNSAGGWRGLALLCGFAFGLLLGHDFQGSCVGRQDPLWPVTPRCESIS